MKGLRLRAGLALLASVALLLSSPYVALSRTEPFAGFDGFVGNAMKQLEVPGVAVAVVKDDKVVFSKGYGVLKVGSDTRVDEKTVFALGSATKPFTATLIGILVDEKKLSFNSRVKDCLKGFEFHDPYVTREATLTDLLSHRTGIPELGLLWYGSPFNRNEILWRLRFQPHIFGFRTDCVYQNAMYLAAGEAAASVSRMSWDDLMKQRIFTPLEMTSTTTSLKELSKFTNVAFPHGKVGGKLTPINFRNLDNIAPASSMYSSVTDVAQWIRMLLNQGKLGEKQILAQETIEELWTPQLRFPKPAAMVKDDPTHFQFVNYGRGFVVQDISGHRAITYTGGTDGMRSFIGLLPAEHVGFVVLTNSDVNDHALALGLGLKILDSYLELPAKDWCTYLQTEWKDKLGKFAKEEEKRLAKRVAGTHSSLGVKSYFGTYRNPIYGDILIGAKDGRFTLQFGPEREANLAHWNFDTFKVIWRTCPIVNTYLTFHLDMTGAVKQFELLGIGTFDKVQ